MHRPRTVRRDRPTQELILSAVGNRARRYGWSNSRRRTNRPGSTIREGFRQSSQPAERAQSRSKGLVSCLSCCSVLIRSRSKCSRSFHTRKLSANYFSGQAKGAAFRPPLPLFPKPQTTTLAAPECTYFQPDTTNQFGLAVLTTTRTYRHEVAVNVAEQVG